MKVLTIGSDINLFKKNSDVAKRAVKYGWQTDKYIIINFAKKGFSKLELSNQVTVYPTNSAGKLFYLLDAFKLAKKIVAREGIEVVSVQNPFEAAVVGWWLKKKFNIGLNIQVHGDFFGSDYWQTVNLKNAFRFRLAKRLLRRADSIRAVSKRIGLSLKRFGIPADKIIIAPIYVDWQDFQNRDSEMDLQFEFTNKFVILSVCRLAAEKNLDLLIEAFGDLSGQYRELVLVIVGAGPEEKKLKAIAARLGLTDKVFFMGWQDEPSGYYKSADLMVITSASEGYNRTVIEAMACGCPIVMSDVGLAGEILIHEQNGLVYEVGDKASLVKSIERMLTDVNLREKFIANGFLAVQKLPSEAELLKRIQDGWQKAVLNKENK